MSIPINDLPIVLFYNIPLAYIRTFHAMTAGRNDMHTTTVTCTLTQSIFIATTPVPTVRHPLTQAHSLVHMRAYTLTRHRH